MSLLRATSPPLEVIVVADGDTSGSWRVAEELGFRVLNLVQTGGPARARNHGARSARGDVLLFLDADVELREDALAEVCTAFAADESLSALFGSYDDAPGATNFLSQYRNLLHHYTHQTSNEVASTFWSGCGAIRRDVFLNLGGFDESYRRPSIEDIELGYRLTRAGHRVRLHKNVQGKHLKEWHAASLLHTDFALRAVPWTELILRDRRFVSDLNLQYKYRASVVLAYTALLGFCAMLFEPRIGIIAAGCVLLVLALNAEQLAFFAHKRGLFFAARVVPWLLLFQLYSGLGFVVGLLRHLTRRRHDAQRGR